MPAKEHTAARSAGDGRAETKTEQLDRNWNFLIQELRVVQTGVQLLTGFLLTLPFQNRFTGLSQPMRWLYLGTVAASVGATVCLIAPVAAHRMLFRRHRIAKVVVSAHRYAFGSGIAGTGADRRRDSHLRHRRGRRSGGHRGRIGRLPVPLGVVAAPVASAPRAGQLKMIAITGWPSRRHRDRLGKG